MRVARTRVASAGADVAGKSVWLAVCAFVITLSLGCGEGDASGPYTAVAPDLPVVPPADPTLGSLAVRTITSGARLDPNGYVVRSDVDWDDPKFLDFRVRTNGTVGVFLTPGEYSFTLLDVAANCDGESLTQRRFRIVAGAVTEVVFQLACR